jgi:hypothetical protein
LAWRALSYEVIGTTERERKHTVPSGCLLEQGCYVCGEIIWQEPYTMKREPSIPHENSLDFPA